MLDYPVPPVHSCGDVAGDRFSNPTQKYHIINIEIASPSVGHAREGERRRGLHNRRVCAGAPPRRSLHKGEHTYNTTTMM